MWSNHGVLSSLECENYFNWLDSDCEDTTLRKDHEASGCGFWLTTM